MHCCELTLSDEKRLLSFYATLSPKVTSTYRPFPEINIEVMQNHLAGVAAKDHISFALEESGEIAGHSFIMNIKHSHPVFGIGLAEAHHGRGWGRILMQRVLAEAENRGTCHLTLTVLKHNTTALTLYKSLGFEIVSDHTFMKQDDSYFMTRGEEAHHVI